MNLKISFEFIMNCFSTNNLVKIFITTKNKEEVKSRLMKRNQDSKEEVKKRLKSF